MQNSMAGQSVVQNPKTKFVALLSPEYGVNHIYNILTDQASSTRRGFFTIDVYTVLAQSTGRLWKRTRCPRVHGVTST